MKSLFFNPDMTFTLLDRDPPQPLPHQTLLQIRAVGVCGSDLHWLNSASIGDDKLEQPFILGHEFCAETEEGKLVAVDPALPCGKCSSCLAGHPNLCPYQHFVGHPPTHGAFQEMIAWDKIALFELPKGFSPEDGAMLEPLGIALHSIDLAKANPGDRVAVLGCGPIGLLIIQLLQLKGAEVILATDRLPHRVAAAQAFGANNCLLVNEPITKNEITNLVGEGVKIVFEVSGDPDAMTDAVNLAAPGGKVILVGIPDEDSTQFQASTARRKGLNFKLVRRMKNTYPRAIQLVEHQKIDVRSIVTSQFKLEEYQQAFKTAVHRDGLKVIINP